MKPTKCRVMCPDCGRQKMLFETEKEAATFLKFNGEEVNPDGTRKMRVYYCPACCGYHISSHEYKGSGRATDRLIERYHRDKKVRQDQKVKALFEALIAQNFTSKKEVQRWLEKQDQYSPITKDRALTHYYEEGIRKGVVVPGVNKFNLPGEGTQGK